MGVQREGGEELQQERETEDPRHVALPRALFALTLVTGIVMGAVPGTLHAKEHAANGMMPLFTICDRWVVGGVSTARQADTGLPWTEIVSDASDSLQAITGEDRYRPSPLLRRLAAHGDRLVE